MGRSCRNNTGDVACTSRASLLNARYAAKPFHCGIFPLPRCNAKLPRKRMHEMSDKNAEALLPVELGPAKVKFAQGIKAGRWVFATGLMAQDLKSGLAPDVLSERAPHAGLPKREKEARRIFENLDAVLRAAGTD